MKKRCINSLILLALFTTLWFTPHSVDIPVKAWHMFAIFSTTIVGIILQPVPMGALSIISICVAVLTRTLSIEQGLSGFNNSVAWLVLLSFSIAKGIVKTGLGERVSLFFIKLFGRNALGLGYGLIATDLLLAPAIPSVVARSGGIVFPMLSGLNKTFDSLPEKNTSKKIGSFLTIVAYHGSTITSAMFMTAMAGNPLLAGLASSMGYPISWSMWALGAIVPGIISLIFIPWLIYKIYPPTLKDTSKASKEIGSKLKALGPLKKNEKMMICVFGILLVLWCGGELINIHATAAALIGISLLIVFNILEWHEVTGNSAAWETFLWFAALIMMAGQLNTLGFIPWVGSSTMNIVGGLSWPIGLALLIGIFFYSHYFFASSTAHITAMFPVFLTIAVGLGTPPMLAVLTLAYAGNLFGGLTHYASGPAPIFFGSGYVSIKEWWSIGFVVSIANLAIWMGIGIFWWKIVGIF